MLKWYKHSSVIHKFLIYLITNKGIIFLIVGSVNFGPAVAGPAGPVPTPLHYIDMNTTQVNKSDAYKYIKVRKVSSWFGSAVGKGMDVRA